eukprot:1566164-Amphidinium_carterae.1
MPPSLVKCCFSVECEDVPQSEVTMLSSKHTSHTELPDSAVGETPMVVWGCLPFDVCVNVWNVLGWRKVGGNGWRRVFQVL